MRLIIPTEQRGRLVTLVCPAKRAEAIEMPCALRTRVGPRKRVLHGSPDPPMEGAILVDSGAHCKV